MPAGNTVSQSALDGRPLHQVHLATEDQAEFVLHTHQVEERMMGVLRERREAVDLFEYPQIHLGALERLETVVGNLGAAEVERFEAR